MLRYAQTPEEAQVSGSRPGRGPAGTWASKGSSLILAQQPPRLEGQCWAHLVEANLLRPKNHKG